MDMNRIGGYLSLNYGPNQVYKDAIHTIYKIDLIKLI